MSFLRVQWDLETRAESSNPNKKAPPYIVYVPERIAHPHNPPAITEWLVSTFKYGVCDWQKVKVLDGIEVNQLFEMVRDHPDFRFGVIFTKHDLITDGKSLIENVEDYSNIEDAMVEVASEMVLDNQPAKRS